MTGTVPSEGFDRCCLAYGLAVPFHTLAALHPLVGIPTAVSGPLNRTVSYFPIQGPEITALLLSIPLILIKGCTHQPRQTTGQPPSGRSSTRGRDRTAFRRAWSSADGWEQPFPLIHRDSLP